ncbi:MAG: hypothetical protein GTN75_09050 [Gemmatimonadetes bacterium]|nr:hypothetical protein [Gemmatimonadota bacterium]
MKLTTRILWLLPAVLIAGSVAGIGLMAARESPVRTPPEGMFGCIHRWDSTWHCPEFNPQEGVNWVPTEAVDTIQIVFKLTNGESLRWSHPMYRGEADSLNVDAVFFTDAAVWNIWFSYLRGRGIDEDSIIQVFRTLPRRDR